MGRRHRHRRGGGSVRLVLLAPVEHDVHNEQHDHGDAAGKRYGAEVEYDFDLELAAALASLLSFFGAASR